MQPALPLEETDGYFYGKNLVYGIGKVGFVNGTERLFKLFQRNGDWFLIPVFSGRIRKTKQEKKKVKEFNGTNYICNSQKKNGKGIYYYGKREK